MVIYNIQSLPEIIVASHREVIPNYAALGPLCVEKIGPEMQRLGCKCPPPGFCFTIEHNKEDRPTDIDIEYCEQVEEMGIDSDIIQFKRLVAVPKALCMKHVGPYERFHESITKAFVMVIRLLVIFVFPTLMVYGIRKILSYGYQ